MEWFNPPTAWAVENDAIEVRADASSDFWRKTHYGFIRDNGHFYYQVVEGDFVAKVKVMGRYQDLYDQAGIMVRSSATHWMKCGIEYLHGVQNVSAVVTNDFSDWSVAPLAQNPPALWLKVTRQAEALEVHYAVDGVNYTLLRIAYLQPAPAIQVGVMCAAPDGQGFDVRFEGFHVEGI